MTTATVSFTEVHCHNVTPGFDCASASRSANGCFVFISVRFASVVVLRAIQKFSGEVHHALRKLSLKGQHVVSYSFAARCHLEHLRKTSALLVSRSWLVTHFLNAFVSIVFRLNARGVFFAFGFSEWTQ